MSSSTSRSLVGQRSEVDSRRVGVFHGLVDGAVSYGLFGPRVVKLVEDSSKIRMRMPAEFTVENGVLTGFMISGRPLTAIIEQSGGRPDPRLDQFESKVVVTYTDLGSKVSITPPAPKYRMTQQQFEARRCPSR